MSFVGAIILLASGHPRTSSLPLFSFFISPPYLSVQSLRHVFVLVIVRAFVLLIRPTLSTLSLFVVFFVFTVFVLSATLVVKMVNNVD